MSLSLDAAISGMLTQQRNIEAIANNLANVNTTAYKRVKIHFQDILDTASVFAALTGPENLADISQSSGVSTASTKRDFAQGALQPSGRLLDFAISGDGFFRVLLDDGSTAYTRAGVFMLDGAGKVATSSGELLDPPLQLPDQFRDLRIEQDGSVTVMRDFTDEELAALDDFAARDGVREVVGQMELARFPNPSGLAAIGNSRYRETPESQAPIFGRPGEDGMGSVFSGWLEASNVDIATEMTGLVMAKRGYQLNLVAYRTIEEMLTKANDVTV
ncbi:MAG: flagellar basal body rod protein FlgG [Chloroflexi bacterium HGW-Chloroflexi-9]|nr:MAG: flagellar basal body rod protein FlgG [Chloroflexi bacterium HGW-Chloroflexi-9]